MSQLTNNLQFIETVLIRSPKAAFQPTLREEGGPRSDKAARAPPAGTGHTQQQRGRTSACSKTPWY